MYLGKHGYLFPKNQKLNKMRMEHGLSEYLIEILKGGWTENHNHNATYEVGTH